MNVYLKTAGDFHKEARYLEPRDPRLEHIMKLISGIPTSYFGNLLPPGCAQEIRSRGYSSIYGTRITDRDVEIRRREFSEFDRPRDVMPCHNDVIPWDDPFKKDSKQKSIESLIQNDEPYPKLNQNF